MDATQQRKFNLYMGENSIMENITLGQVAVVVASLAAFITGLGVLYGKLKKWLKAVFKEELEPISKSIEKVEKRLDDVDLESTKNYLVTYLSNVEKGNAVDEIEQERFWEMYNHYSKVGGNSYIKHKVEKLEAAKKL